jgi:RNA polymerase sigma-70 factor (ECF subfamily)
MNAQPENRSVGRSSVVSARTGDAELLRAVAAGSEPAFAELRGRYRAAVARVCAQVGVSEREDCEQEVFARVWRKAALFDPARGSAAVWLLTLARRTVLNVQASRRRMASPTSDEPEPAALEQADVEAFWIEAALQQLSERERTVIELAYAGDLSEQAIARRLQVPLGSVKSWKRRGLNRLAGMLGEQSP